MQASITDDDYAWMHYLRRSVAYPPEGTPELARWMNLYDRFYAQHPHTLERDAWHEAGHVVVAHRLGGRVESVSRDEEGAITSVAVFERRHVGLLLWAALEVAGYLAEVRAVGRVDPHEASEVGVAFQDVWRQRYGGLPPEAEVLDAVTHAETVAATILDEHWAAVARVADTLMNEPWPIERDRLTELIADVPYGDLLVMDGALGSALQFAMSAFGVWHVQGGKREVLTARATYQAAEVAARAVVEALREQGGEGQVTVQHREALLRNSLNETI